MTIRQVLNLLIDRRIRESSLYSKTGTIKSVSESNRTCTVTIDNVDYQNILLQGTIGLASGLVQIPSIGSQVKVSFLSGTAGFISMFSQLDKIIIDTNLVQFNGGANNGIIKIDSNVTKLNNIEQDINTLKNIFSTWAVAPTDGGAALKTAAASWYASALTETVRADLEDTKITH